MPEAVNRSQECLPWGSAKIFLLFYHAGPFLQTRNIQHDARLFLKSIFLKRRSGSFSAGCIRDKPKPSVIDKWRSQSMVADMCLWKLMVMNFLSHKELESLAVSGVPVELGTTPTEHSEE